MKLIQRYEYFSSREELDKFLDKFPGNISECKVVFDGEKKWALETINDLREVHKLFRSFFDKEKK